MGSSRPAWSPPQVARLPDGRLHLQHGPIDLVIGATGTPADVDHAFAAAAEHFGPILPALAAELPLLRRPLVGDEPPVPMSPVARRMVAACWPHSAVFITPMAAVAGSVADEIAYVMRAAAPELATLHVNNGGDIAVHVAAGATLRIGLVPDLVNALPEGVITLDHLAGVGGVATSGWRGRSFSLGLADAVTVLAATAAGADAAATIIANAVDADHPAIVRTPARGLDPDSDLGDMPVTTEVGPLPLELVETALESAERLAERLLIEGRIIAAAIALQGRWRFVEGKTKAPLITPRKDEPAN